MPELAERAGAAAEVIAAVSRYVAVRRLLFQGVAKSGRPFDEVWAEKAEAWQALVAIEGGEPFTGTRGPFLEDDPHTLARLQKHRDLVNRALDEFEKVADEAARDL